MFYHVLQIDTGETVYAGNSAVLAERAFEGRVVCGKDADRRTVARERAEAAAESIRRAGG